MQSVFIPGKLLSKLHLKRYKWELCIFARSHPQSYNRNGIIQKYWALTAQYIFSKCQVFFMF